MSDVTFVRTRHVYESYADFWALVELAGFPTCFADELDPTRKKATYILPVRNGECDAGWPGAKARIIFWNLEYHVEYGPWPGVAETWSPDQWHAEKIGARYVPMGSDARLADGPDTHFDKAYDVAYMGYMVNRRSDVLTALNARGLHVSPTSAWGAERHAILSNSTVYLHVHQTDHAPAIPALRMVVAAAYGLPVICEEPARRGLYGYSHFLTSDHAHIAEFAGMWAKDKHGQFRGHLGHALHSLLCEQLPFRRSVEVSL